jgi:hypothetical protein
MNGQSETSSAAVVGLPQAQFAILYLDDLSIAEFETRTQREIAKNSAFKAGNALPLEPLKVMTITLMSFLALTVIVVALARAPQGYEDQTGFHFA